MFRDSSQAKSADPVTYDKDGNVIPLSERFNPEEEDIRFSRGVDLDEETVYNKTVVLKESTVDKYLKDYAAESTPNYAQAYLAYMSPDQFLRLTTSYGGRGRIAKDTGPLDTGKLADATVHQPFQLIIDHETGEVNGHEGRHRAMALQRVDISRIPVLLFDSSNKYDKQPIDALELTGQFNEYASAIVHDVQPLSYANRDTVMDTFAKQPTIERIAERYGRETVRYSRGDIREKLGKVDDDIHDLVDVALSNWSSNDEITIALATKRENSDINRLGEAYRGKYTGSKRTFSQRYVRHVMNQHGNALIEALSGQLVMDPDAIKIALSELRNGNGRIVGRGFSARGMPTIRTRIPVNGYALYIEEPIDQPSGTSLQGRTMYKVPASTTALNRANRTSPYSIPQRRGAAPSTSIDGKDRIVNGYLTSGDGKTTELYVQKNINDKRGTYGLIPLCLEPAPLTTISKVQGQTVQARVKINNPYIVTHENPVITEEDKESGEIPQRIQDIKDAGYDAIILDYDDQKNYFVMVFKNSAVEEIPEGDRTAEEEQHSRPGVREALDELIDEYGAIPPGQNPARDVQAA